MRRDLFVFAGQSNMMGASVLPPKKKISVKNSYEYKHKARRLGASIGDFVVANYPVGEFSYIDLEKAYSADMVNEKGESKLDDYAQNTYFCPAMFNLDSKEEKTVRPFPSFSEATAPYGVTLAPLLAEEWEQRGQCCAYTHIAKGGVAIIHFFNRQMREEYVRRIKTDNVPIDDSDGAADYFFEKCKHFIADAQTVFPDDTLENKCFFWLQGESDARNSIVEYETKLDILWEELKKIGFTHFFCIRVNYFGHDGISNVMKAQENFVAKHSDAYMLTRVASYFTHPLQNEREWFISVPLEIYRNCRDSFYGYNNHHINEKGFSMIAERATGNLYRVLIENKQPLLEDELVRALITI